MSERETPKKVALVTGANRGIGLEVCRQLAARGLRVVLTGRDRRRTASAAEQVAKDGLDVSAAVMDVTDDDSVRACEQEITKRLGYVDVLVNNAAILLADDGLLQTPIEDVRSTFETNVIGVLRVCQTLVPGMIARRYGRVVNVSSAAGQLSSMTTYAPAYSISKTALNALTVQLAACAKGTGVLVNCVNPGWVRTRMGGSSAPTSAEEGADTIVWAATLPANGPTGAFLSGRGRIAW
jgi:NAD(P)-dependent dehydrogenase (short-subunit alcohol dehydrogenase family)